MRKPKPLMPRQHAVFRLTADLLLVFKPRGHREAPHAHAHRQRLRVLRGALRVRIAARVVTLRPTSRTLTIPARRIHSTSASQDTWLIAQTITPEVRRPQRRARRLSRSGTAR